jgi:3-phosphoglycerate kinase
MLPVDVVIFPMLFSNEANFRTVKFNEMPENWMGMDIGEETQKYLPMKF